MKKLFLLTLLTISPIAADIDINTEIALSELTAELTPEQLENLKQELEKMVAIASLQEQAKEFTSEAPLLIEYFKESFAKGLGCGFGSDFVANFFDETPEAYLASAGLIYGQAIARYCCENRERADFAKQVTVAQRCNLHLWKMNPELEGYALFQPDQFKIQHETYRYAIMLAGFLSGAVIGSKLGTLASDGCMSLWDRLCPASFIAI